MILKYLYRRDGQRVTILGFVVNQLKSYENCHLLYRFVSTKGETLISRYIFLVRIKIMSPEPFLYINLYIFIIFIL